MTTDARERMDNMLMSITEVHCLRFVAPSECKSKDDQRSGYGREWAPGIYLRQDGHGTSPTAKPNNPETRLTLDQARTLAGAIDAVTKVSAHGGGAFGRGGGDVPYPASYVQFVNDWHEALGRRLGRAIKASEDRLASLRMTRAAITGIAD